MSIVNIASVNIVREDIVKTDRAVADTASLDNTVLQIFMVPYSVGGSDRYIGIICVGDQSLPVNLSCAKRAQNVGGERHLLIVIYSAAAGAERSAVASIDWLSVGRSCL
jgi:hypothetical protein